MFWNFKAKVALLAPVIASGASTPIFFHSRIGDSLGINGGGRRQSPRW
ncbi:hypothetical protein [Candidatus Mycoplasma haematominutum]|nr:hypothetical protein [Candidatus Mycoplasma haematominutum]